MKRLSVWLVGLGVVAAPLAIAAEPRSAKPLGNPGEWVRPDDYPASAVHDEWEGVVSFKLDISIAGRVEKCTVTVSSGHDVLDDAACNLITQRAIFEPATDKRGRPAQGSYSNRVVWKFKDPGQSEGLFNHPRSTLDVTLLLDGDGKVIDCNVKAADGLFKEIAAGKRGPCENPPPVGKVLDGSGIPQKQRVHVLFNVSIDPVP